MKNGFHSCAAWLLAAPLFAAAVATFSLSLNHPVSADLAMLHYSAWLINEKSFVLYRDIFELNFPAPFMFHSLLGQWLGYEALPLRFVDLSLLVLLGIVSWKILAPISRPAALLAPSLFTLLYLINGGEFVLERDVLALIPAAAAFLFATSAGITVPWKIFLAAIFTAIACSMKPNAVVAVPAMLWFLWLDIPQKNAAAKLRVSAMFILCMTITAAVPFIWASQHGNFHDFIKIYKTFAPIYTASRYDLWHYGSTAERLTTLARNYFMYGGGALLLSLPGLLWAWTVKPGERQRILQLAAITFAFTFYEAIAGKFWLNHMFPSGYWTLLCIALLLTSAPASLQNREKVLAVFFLVPVAVLGAGLATISLAQMYAAHETEKQAPENWRARQIAKFLIRQEIKPEERVQVMDMAGDGQAALLQAKATSATRHLIDVPLYLEPDSPATQLLRKEFIQDLEVKKPRFFVYVEQYLHPGGGNRLREFRQLATMIDQDYEIAEQREGIYTIYRRKLAAQ